MSPRADLPSSTRPPGLVSSIRGRRQGPALLWVSRLVLVVAVLGGLIPGPAGLALAVVAVGLVVAVPLARVVWLVIRWSQEGDLRFVAVGLALIATVAIGATLAALGIGS